jgi:hypothetical protein
VPAGAHEVQIAFGPTRTRTAAALASVGALAALGWYLSRGRQQWLVALALAPAAFFAAAGVHDAVRPALGAPVQPTAGQQRLVVDVIAATEAHQVQIASPSGPALGPFVNLQRLYLPSRERRWLYMHPPSSVSLALTLPPRAAFQAGLGLDPRTWDADGADGVRYLLEVTPDGGTTTRVLDEQINPRARTEQRLWLDRWVDLSTFGGQHVTLTLRTDPANTVDYDWAGWADPIVFVQQDARRPGGGPAAPLPTPRAS